LSIDLKLFAIGNRAGTFLKPEVTKRVAAAIFGLVGGALIVGAL
jgi:hypothetical protein